MLFVKRFLAYVMGWFVGKKEEAVQTLVDEPPRPVKRTYKKRTPFFTIGEGGEKTTLSFPQSFSELLDNLDIMFSKLRLPTELSWLSADERVGLTRLGIYLPHPWFMVNPGMEPHPRVNMTPKMPAIVCAACPNTNEYKDDRYAPFLMFAIKNKSFPLGVQQVTGIPYKVGMAFDIRGKLTWYVMWASINPSTGEITFCKELQHRIQTVKRGYYYSQKVVDLPSILQDDPEVNRQHEEITHVYKVIFAHVFNWWTDRKDKSWNVAVKKDKRRITFSINRSETKRYFADRDKVVVASGRTKRIVHYVAEHKRVVNGKTVLIKEHLRGEDKFKWNGYDCAVTAPKFSHLASVDFDIAGAHEEDVDERDVRNFVGLNKLAQIIAAREEQRIQ